MSSKLTEILDAGAALTRAIDKRLDPLGLSAANYRILKALHEAEVVGEGRLTPSMLAALLLQEPHSVSGMLNRLERLGFLTRKQEGRIVYVELTYAGREKGAAAANVVAEISAAVDRAFDGGILEDADVRLIAGIALAISDDAAPIRFDKRLEAMRLIGGAE